MALRVVAPWRREVAPPPVHTPGRAAPATLEISVGSLLSLFIAVLAVGQLGRLPVVSAGAKEAPFLLNDAMLLLVLAGAGLHAVRQRSFRLDLVAWLALLFAAVGGASALLAIPRFGLTGFETAFSLAYLARWLAYFGIYAVVLNTTDRAGVDHQRRMLERTVLAFAAFGIVQSAFLPDFAQRLFPDAALYTQWDPQGHRLVSTFLDPNLAGALLGLVLLLNVGRAAFGVPVSFGKVAVLIVALGLTVSRSSLLAVVAGGLVVFAVRFRSRRLLTLVAGGLGLVLVTLPITLGMAVAYNKLDLADPSLLARFVAWGRAWEVLRDHPLLGVGFNTYGFVQERYGFGGLNQSAFGLDGGLLFVAVMTGIVGVLVYSAMVGVALRRCVRAWEDPAHPPDVRALALGTAGATVALLVHSLFLNSLLYPFLMEVLWLLWGWVFVLTRGPRAADEACASR